MTEAFSAKQKVDQALEALRAGLSPYVAEKMEKHYGKQWRHYASRAAGGTMAGELDAYGLLKTVLDNYSDVFRHEVRLRKARSYISLALDARNSASHFDGFMQDREALRYLDAIRELLDAVGAKPQGLQVDDLYQCCEETDQDLLFVLKICCAGRLL